MGGHQLLMLLIVLPEILGTRLPYIIGGQEVGEQGRYPWQGSLQDIEHVCGVSLISKRWALTAAHCAAMLIGENHSVIFGTNDLEDKRARRYKVKNIKTHDHFGMHESGYPNDIALLELEGDVDTSGSFVKPIRLANESQSFAGYRNCWISGWGNTIERGQTPDILRVSRWFRNSSLLWPTKTNLLVPGRFGFDLRSVILKLRNLDQVWISLTFLVKLPSGECHKTSLMISKHRFKWWLGSARPQVITWTNVDHVYHTIWCHWATMS